MQVVFFRPEIPPNTGTMARTCAATRTAFHLIEPLGFELSEKRLRRAGLDYWPHVDVHVWPDLDRYLEEVRPPRLVLTSARRGGRYCDFAYRPDDALVFGPETKGLPDEVHAPDRPCVRIPIWGEVRSLNLACAATLLLYEAYRLSGGLPEG